MKIDPKITFLLNVKSTVFDNGTVLLQLSDEDTGYSVSREEFDDMVVKANEIMDEYLKVLIDEKQTPIARASALAKAASGLAATTLPAQPAARLVGPPAARETASPLGHKGSIPAPEPTIVTRADIENPLPEMFRPVSKPGFKSGNQADKPDGSLVPFTVAKKIFDNFDKYSPIEQESIIIRFAGVPVNHRIKIRDSFPDWARKAIVQAALDRNRQETGFIPAEEGAFLGENISANSILRDAQIDRDADSPGPEAIIPNDIGDGDWIVKMAGKVKQEEE